MLENSEKPLLVDFYATWCGPCQFMVPILNGVGESMKDKIQVVKIDTEKYPSLADKYKMQALPTFILFKDGDVCDRFEGIDATHRICTGSKAVVLACCLSSCLDHRFEVIRV